MPCPDGISFPLATEIRSFLSGYTDYFVLDIRVNDDQHSIERPFSDSIPFNDNFEAPFEALETSVIPRPDGDDPAAVLWLAHTRYAGSIPRRLGVRGLRARFGNMQIGTDRIFEHHFQESRFNGWCVGEIHILDSRIVPNGRRDYFEPGPHLRNLENHIGALAQQISARCRRASSQRNKLRNVDAAVQRLNQTRELACSGYLRLTDAAALLERERARVRAMRETLARVQTSEGHSSAQSLDLSDKPFNEFDVKPNPALENLAPGIARCHPTRLRHH